MFGDTAPDWVLLIGLILGPTGAVWATVRASIYGLREDVRDIKRELRATRTRSGENAERISRLEGPDL